MQKSNPHIQSIFSNNDKFVIIGFPKCGTSSLIYYLENMFPKYEIKKIETMIYDPHGVAEFMDSYSDFTPVIITRDPADRLWSGYYYYQLNKTMQFEDFVKRRTDGMFHAGLGEPIKQSVYEDYTKSWHDLEPIRLTLEDMSKIDDFPHLLITDNTDKFPMPAFYRSLVEKSIQFYKDKRDRLEAIERGDIIPNVHGTTTNETESIMVDPKKTNKAKGKDDDGTKFNADNYSFT